MGARSRAGTAPKRWNAIPDPAGKYSSGVPDFDRLLGGGFARGSMALFHLDSSVTTEDRDMVLTPILLNFLHQSRGVIAVLPSRDSPHAFRDRLTRYVTRRRFDGRVRIVDYVGEDDDLPYVVALRAAPGNSTAPAAVRNKKREADIAKMVAAERAAQGKRKRSFLEMNAFEVIETVTGAETAARMFLHGIKRARAVNNLVVGLARPGLGCVEAVRAMADAEFELRHDDVGLMIRGLHPAFPNHVVVPDRALGPPHVAFVPGPLGAPGALTEAATSSGRTRRP
ncbi:MAG TPA: gas vesicle protein GvpD basic region 2 domain-containing protein [Thermoplasmata archaeon]|nr:gas vesicle protein GvpD basic region 2 domain-containing protein [Thermoplasmata archaeon]